MNLDAQVKNRFNISEILKKILLKINKLENNSNGGDFIPLTGTTGSNPVTGDIEVKAVKLKSFIEGEGGNLIDFTRPDEGLVIEHYNYEGIKQAELLVNGANVSYAPKNESINNSIGFYSPFDFSEADPSNKQIYTQRSYVDKANSYSTDETLTDGTWIDGKPIYRRVVTGQAILDDLNIGFDYNIDNLITAEGYILLKHDPFDETTEVRLPYIYNGDIIEFHRIGTIPHIYVQNDNNTFSESFQNTYTFIIEYTKRNN